jgi:flavin reductase (DIM6/NTAB) family NADH-FMN oxidoreductase RutF
VSTDLVLGQRSFRDVLGRFPTGVVLVTAATPDGPLGMAMNSFASVSLDPPLIVVCAATTSTTWPGIRAAGGFAVTMLGSEHAGLCRLFSTRGAERFAGREWSTTPAGHPVLADGLAWLDCRISTVHPAGDHELVLALALTGAVVDHRAPLVFHAGRYTALAC